MTTTQKTLHQCLNGGTLSFVRGRASQIDQQELTPPEEGTKRWRNVLTRLISIILSLASRNLASRGSSQHLYEPDNGNFLKEVELLAKFDPVMENHLARIKDKSTHTHYLGQRIHIELIQIISDRVLQTIVSCVQEAKYYSIILDCTPDASHKDVSRTVQCCTETQARS